MLPYITAPLITIAYAILYGTWAGAIAGILVAFVQFAFAVITHPLTIESPSETLNRKALSVEVAWLMLTTAAVGCVLANLS